MNKWIEINGFSRYLLNIEKLSLEYFRSSTLFVNRNSEIFKSKGSASIINKKAFNHKSYNGILFENFGVINDINYTSSTTIL